MDNCRIDSDESYTPSATGNYAVELMENGCVDTSACVTITTVGILENDFGEKFRVFPNPTGGNFSIDLGASYSTVDISCEISTNLGSISMRPDRRMAGS